MLVDHISQSAKDDAIMSRQAEYIAKYVVNACSAWLNVKTYVISESQYTTSSYL